MAGSPPASRSSRWPARHCAAPRRRPPHSAPGRRKRRAPVILLAGQVALALVLLVATGLFTHSFMRLFGRTFNFDPDHLLSFEFRIPVTEFSQPLGAEDAKCDSPCGRRPRRGLAASKTRFDAFPASSRSEE